MDAEILGALEAFSRDLLSLVRAVRVYPRGHPFLQELATRLASTVGRTLPSPLSLGVTAKDLAVESRFFGGRDTRSSDLAAFLHGRKVLRLTWREEATDSDVVGFAEALADPKSGGEELQKALRSRRIYSIDIDPLSLERIHDLFRETPQQAPGDAAVRGREAWLWLLSDEVPPGQVAEILSGDEFWEESGPGALESSELTGILARLGERLGAALDALPREQRRKVQDRLARAGRRLSPNALANLLQTADLAGFLKGPMGDALEETFGGDKLVDLLAGLVAQEGRSTRRLAEVYGRFGRGKASELLPQVRARLSWADKGGFATEVWDTVEEFLLARQEDPYMNVEYAASLEDMASEAPLPPESAEGLDFSEAVEPHLDRLLLGLAWHDADGWAKEFLDRLEDRLSELEPRALLGVLQDVDQGGKALLDARPALLERAFRLCLGALRTFDAGARQALLAFAQAHEGVLLGPVLRCLEEEGSIAVRKFLVEIVAGFSPSSTPPLVSRIRSAPWYVARNLTMALGKRREPLAIPVFRSLVGHEHPKVRREAILALGFLDSAPGREALEEVVHRVTSSPEERELAERALRTPRFGEDKA